MAFLLIFITSNLKIMKPHLLLLLIVLLFSCKKELAKTDYLGVVDLEVSGSKKALPHFEKGLLLLHSFEYADAREEFLKAQELDPKMAMAYWGEAMTYNHSLWHEQDYDKGISALNKLTSLDEDLKITPLENHFLEGVQILYKTEATKKQRDKDYALYMGELLKKYPENHEVAAFYALSLLGSVEDGRDDELFGKGAKIAQGILKENPNHPGALHYLIHAYDDPYHAQYALSAADTYAVVAPDASHALHMPSHIYVAMGMWDKVVSSNENSYQASLNRMQRKNLKDGRGYHAYHWLEYGYLQQGREEDARKLVQDMVIFTEENPSKYARTHLVFLKGTYLVETENWDSPIADISVDIADMNVAIRSQYHFLEGMKAFQRGNSKLLDENIESIRNDFDKESFLVTYDDVSFCSGVERDDTTPSNLTETQVMLEQLLALKAWLNMDPVATEDHLKKSILLDDTLSYNYGPPFIQKPTHELYADWLVVQNRTEEALIQYDETLKRAPNRTLAVKRMEKLKSALASL